MSTNNITTALTLVQLNALIAEVTAAERITKAGLSTLSRELLAFAYEHGDITPINSLMGTDEGGKFRLTPINWRIAAQYFNHFVAFTSNFEKDIKAHAVKGEGTRQALVFNKKSKEKYTRLVPTVTAWLAEPSNDLWSWSADIEMEVKAPDYLKNAMMAFKACLDEEKGAMSFSELLTAIIAEDGITADLDEIREVLSGGSATAE